MSRVIPFLACSLQRRDELPNIELAERIAENNDAEAVRELAGHLRHKSKDIRYDCVKTLYEIGSRKPALIAPWFDAFLTLLDSRDNRLQWGGMTALSTLTEEKPAALFNALSKIIDTADKGSVVTRDHCIKIMARLALLESYRNDVLPLLFEQILAAPVNQLPMYAELCAPAVDATHRAAFLEVLQMRLADLDLAPKRKRIEKVMRLL